MSMADITRAIDLSEGDLVMTFNKTIDLMRQVREMLVHALPGHALIDRLSRAEKLLRRGIVEQSLTIGFNPIEAPAEPDDTLTETDEPSDY
jgi:ATP-dependent RNA helicase HelY